MFDLNSPQKLNSVCSSWCSNWCWLPFCCGIFGVVGAPTIALSLLLLAFLLLLVSLLTIFGLSDIGSRPQSIGLSDIGLTKCYIGCPPLILYFPFYHFWSDSVSVNLFSDNSKVLLSLHDANPDAIASKLILEFGFYALPILCLYVTLYYCIQWHKLFVLCTVQFSTLL